MTPPRLIACLLAAGLLAAPARAAEFEKYLPDDTDAVLTLNVKQALGSAVYTKHLQKFAADAMKKKEIQDFLQGTGFDPLKDIERVTVVTAKSCWPAPGEYQGKAPEGSPLFVLEGKLTAAMLKTLVEKAAKQDPKTKVTEQKVAGTTVWEAKGDGPDTVYFAAADKGVFVIGAGKAAVTEAVEKGAGKKKTMLKNKDFSGLLAKVDPKATVSWAGVGDLVSDTYREKKSSDGKTTTNLRHQTLADKGIASLSGSVTVADDIKAQATLICKDADTAKKLATQAQDGLGNGIKLLSAQKELAPLADAMKSVKVKQQDKTLAVEGQAKPEAIEALVNLMMVFGQGGPPKK